MWGINLYTGGHFDDYQVKYTHYNSNSIPDDVFAFDPSNCTYSVAAWLLITVVTYLHLLPTCTC